MTTEHILYGCFTLQYTSTIEGLHAAIKYYTKFGVVYKLMIAPWCGK
jgi:hypothetical protein